MKVISFTTEGIAGAGSQCVVAIIGDPGRIYTPMVYIDAPTRRVLIPNGDIKLFGRDLPPELSPTVKGAARKMLKAGKRLGITSGAKKFLRSVL